MSPFSWIHGGDRYPRVLLADSRRRPGSARPYYERVARADFETGPYTSGTAHSRRVGVSLMGPGLLPSPLVFAGEPARALLSHARSKISPNN